MLHAHVFHIKTYQIGDVTVLLELHSGELSHIGPGGSIRYIVCAADNISPQ